MNISVSPARSLVLHKSYGRSLGTMVCHVIQFIRDKLEKNISYELNALDFIYFSLSMVMEIIPKKFKSINTLHILFFSLREEKNSRPNQ